MAISWPFQCLLRLVGSFSHRYLMKGIKSIFEHHWIWAGQKLASSLLVSSLLVVLIILQSDEISNQLPSLPVNFQLGHCLWVSGGARIFYLFWESKQPTLKFFCWPQTAVVMWCEGDELFKLQFYQLIFEHKFWSFNRRTINKRTKILSACSIVEKIALKIVFWLLLLW